jgi:hypothetical protein
MIQMHRLILNAPKGADVDHINGNGLDNRRENLRICSRAENLRNRGIQRNNQTGYKGVCWNKSKNTYTAQIQYEKTTYRLGTYPSAKEAALAYDKAARRYFGKFAKLNFPGGG